MLDRNGIWEIAGRQLALDYSCTMEDLKGPGITVTKADLWEGRRIYDHDGCYMKILCLGTGAVIRTQKEMIPWVTKNLEEADPAWLFEYPMLRRLDRELNTYGHEIADVHHYYLPIGDGRETSPRFPVRWYEEEEISSFEDDDRFGEAFVFGAAYPNVLAVAAMDGETIMGMAGASADSERIWQIGIDVMPSYRGKGIGANLTALLSEEIMRRGRVPFYGTAESHILSQRVAIQAGFHPAWAEAYTRKVR
ncbi:MAG TPA: GNAT family N-acetyltransferase [Clostridiaceae bacterium]|nr:GNAT family N-acetyltransferase [Clostridiaceae bacterium]